jgi:uronate dehydrogenase
MRRVLVTGSAGRVGRAAVGELVRCGHHVVGYDLRPTPSAQTSIVATLADVAVLREAARGCDTIIHLAATPDDAKYPRAPHDGDNFVDGLVPNNLLGAYQVFEIARQLRTPKLIVASTGQVIERNVYQAPLPIDPRAPYQPRYLYACTKVWLEAMSQVYAREHQLNILAVRLGWCPRDAGQVAEITASADHQDVYLSPGDAGRFFTACVERDWRGYAMLYVASRHTHRAIFDLSDARRIVNYEPEESWPNGATDGIAG